MVYDYWHWNNMLSEDTRQNIIKDFKENNNGNENKNLQATNENGNIKNSNTLISTVGKLPGLNSLLDIGYKVNSEKFGYNVYEKNNLDNILLNQYKSNMSYDWHTDESKDIIKDIKLTLLLNLSDDNGYEGGKFQIFHNVTDTIDFKPGDMIMIKSYLHHKVTPVTKGERITLTHFITGPRFI